MEGSSVVIYTELLLFLLLLFLSGFFSSSEVVFFGTNRFLLKKYSQRRFYSLVNKLSFKAKGDFSFYPYWQRDRQCADLRLRHQAFYFPLWRKGYHDICPYSKHTDLSFLERLFLKM
jgi:hypothetical protein